MSVLVAVLSVITVFCAAGVVLSRRPINSAMWLVCTLCLVAVHFAVLSAEFLAIVQVLVYAGAVMVLIVFVIMMLGSSAEAGESPFVSLGFIGSMLTGILLAALVVGLVPAFKPISAIPLAPDYGTVMTFGKALFSDYLYIFNVTGVLLMTAIISAVVLVKDSRRPLPPGRGLRAKREQK